MTRKEMIFRAMKNSQEAYETCRIKDSDPEPVSDNDKKIRLAMIETAALA